MSKKSEVKDEICAVVDKHFGRIEHLESRIDEYHYLVRAIDILCEGSKSKLSEEIGKLIGKHYEL